MLKNLAAMIIRRSEARVGVRFDYVHQIARTSLGLLIRYNRIFGFLDKNSHCPPLAYHCARLRGAVSADCGTCVEAEINLAKLGGLSGEVIDHILSRQYGELSDEIAAVARLADAVTESRIDAPHERDKIRDAFGEAGLIELAFAMNGAALLPGIKRSMGYATACDIATMRKIAAGQ